MPIALSDRLAVMARHIVNNMEIEPIKKPTMNHNADILSLPILIYGTKELRPNHNSRSLSGGEPHGWILLPHFPAATRILPQGSLLIQQYLKKPEKDLSDVF